MINELLLWKLATLLGVLGTTGGNLAAWYYSKKDTWKYAFLIWLLNLILLVVLLLVGGLTR